MRKWKVTGNTEYCGTDFEDVFEAENLRQAEEFAGEIAMENAAGYEYLVFGWCYSIEDYMEEYGVSREVAEQEMEEAYDEYRDNVEWGVEEISDEEYSSYF